MIDRATYDQRRATLTARLSSLAAPPTPAPASMPPQHELAAAVRLSTNEELAEVLDLLEVEMVVGNSDVRIVSFRPVLGQGG